MREPGFWTLAGLAVASSLVVATVCVVVALVSAVASAAIGEVFGEIVQALAGVVS